MVAKIIKYFPGIYVLLIFIGFAKFYIYYFTFGINISEYLNLSEIPILIMPTILYSVLFLIILILEFYVIYIFLGKKQSDNNKQVTSNIENTIKNLEKRQRVLLIFKSVYEYTLLVFAIIGASIFIYVFIQLSLGNYISENLELVAYLSYIDKMHSENGWILSRFKKTNIFIAAFIILFSIGILVNSLFTSEKIKEGRSPFTTEFQYENKLIKSDTSNIYIGSTLDYIFLYNRILNQSSVYKKSDIKEFKIKMVKK